jgi:hypothetical protein
VHGAAEPVFPLWIYRIQRDTLKCKIDTLAIISQGLGGRPEPPDTHTGVPLVPHVWEWLMWESLR